MFSCPTDDIHSIYLDSELPPIYVRQYEAHVKSCRACAEKIRRLQDVRLFFSADSKNIAPDAQFLEQSFFRLQTKLRYSQNTTQNRGVSWRSFRIGIAAAAVIAAAIPIRGIYEGGGKQQASPITPVSQPTGVPIASRPVVINGNIHSNLVNAGSLVNTSLAGIEMFRPEFMNAKNVTPKPPMPWLDGGAPEPVEIRLSESSLLPITFSADFQE